MPIIRYLFKANLREETPVVVGGREDVKMVLPGGKETIIFSVKLLYSYGVIIFLTPSVQFAWLDTDNLILYMLEAMQFPEIL